MQPGSENPYSSFKKNSYDVKNTCALPIQLIVVNDGSCVICPTLFVYVNFNVQLFFDAIIFQFRVIVTSVEITFLS